MQPFSIVLLLLSILGVSLAEEPACECGLQSTSRVIGGNTTKPNEYPWAVYVSSPISNCGGSVIGPLSILTAAHCVRNGITMLPASEVTVTVGMHGYGSGTDLKVVAIHKSPDYKPANAIDYDIAILKLAEPLQYSKIVSPICIPVEKKEYHFRFLTLAGWGMHIYTPVNGTINAASPYELQHTTVEYVPRKYLLTA